MTRLRGLFGLPDPGTFCAVVAAAFLIGAGLAACTTTAPPRPAPRPGPPSAEPAPAPMPSPPPQAEPASPTPVVPPPPPDQRERTAPAGGRAPSVRVVLTSAKPEDLVVIEGGWTHRTHAGESERGVGFSRSLGDLGLPLVSTLSTPTDVEVTPDAPGDLRVGSRRYGGRLVLRMTHGGGFGRPGVSPSTYFTRAEVVLDAESYLEGVVAGELPTTFPAEAQRAQAILARTYLLSQPGTEPHDPWISVDDTGLTDQEFVGIAQTAAQRSAVHHAVSTTRGLVLFDGRRALRAWYHSICGGHTTPSGPVFNVPQSPALAGVPCSHCVGTKYYRWDARIAGAKVAKALVATGDLKSFRVTQKSPEGRATVLEVKVGARTITTAAPAFRLAVGPSELRSVWFDRADVVGGDLVVSGRGWGHGVGMCQWGAKGLADRGATAEAILAHYYPGATLRAAW